MIAALTFGLALTLQNGVFAQTPPTAPPPAPDTTQPAPEQAPNTPNYNFQYNGLIDGYYLFQFHNPRDTNVLTGRVYDVRHNTPALALAEVNLLKNARPGGFGFKATLTVGDVADINHADFQGGNSGRGEARFKNVQQLYGTYAFAGGGGIDVGKFYTPFGYEVTESNANYNYSRSLPFAFLPFYNAGGRVYSPNLHGFTGTLYVVNSLFNTTTAGVQEDNNRKDVIGQLNYTDPGGAFTLITTFGYGQDKFIPTQDSKVTLSDTDFTYNLNAAQLFGLNYTYGKINPDGPDNTSRTNGYAVYYKQALTPKTGFALRFSGLETRTDGANQRTRPREVTGTYEFKPAVNFVSRLEYRHDFTNVDNTFLGGNSTASKKNQDTLSLSGVFTF